MTLIMEEIIRGVARPDYEPFPGMTKEKLKALIGDRLDNPNFCKALCNIVTFDPDGPLTFIDRVYLDYGGADAG